MPDAAKVKFKLSESGKVCKPLVVFPKFLTAGTTDEGTVFTKYFDGGLTS